MELDERVMSAHDGTVLGRRWRGQGREGARLRTSDRTSCATVTLDYCFN